jgi:hypothetical protein
MGRGILSQTYSTQEIELTSPSKIVPKLKMGRAIPLLHLRASTVKTEATLPSGKICNGKQMTQHNAVISNISLLCFIVILIFNSYSHSKDSQYVPKVSYI